jgi:hypothetical protein
LPARWVTRAARRAFKSLGFRADRVDHPPKRVNRQIKRPAHAIGISPDDEAITRLVGAAGMGLGPSRRPATRLGTNDERAVARRNMSLESLARFTDDPNVGLPAVAA